MADISQELSAIKNSVYGKNMRTAIHDAIKKVNEDGGGGGSGGATIDTLWSDSNGATVVTEYTMAGNINDYDLICMKIGAPSDTQQSSLYTQLTFAVAGYTSGELISWEGYNKRYCHMSFSGDKFTVVTSEAENEASGYRPTVYEIIGIKF